jgi:hypothetical protein
MQGNYGCLTVSGPHLSFSKNYLFMKGGLGEIVQDKIVVTNSGTTAVTYEWRKVHRKDHIASKHSDFVQRFFCHYVSANL